MGTSGYEEKHGHKFLGLVLVLVWGLFLVFGFCLYVCFCFSACFIYPRFGVAETDSLKMPINTGKRSPNKSLPSLTKRVRKRQNIKAEHF